MERGTRIDEYEILAFGAVGGMSHVYRARRLTDGRPVAIKVLHEMWCDNDQLRARFCNEARALEAIRHPHIVEAMGLGVTPEGLPYMALEWLPSTVAHALDRAGGRLPYGPAAGIVAAIVRALAALHERHIIHRDLKPINVLLSHDDPATATIKLGDLGLAKVSGDGTARAADDERPRPLTPMMPVSTGSGMALGTWDYMAPEQWIHSKAVTPAVDVYALGVLFFQMLTGRLPFIAEDERALMTQHLFEEPPWHCLDGCLADTDITPELRRRLAGMLSKRPSDRPSIDTLAGWFSTN